MLSWKKLYVQFASLCHFLGKVLKGKFVPIPKSSRVNWVEAIGHRDKNLTLRFFAGSLFLKGKFILNVFLKIFVVSESIG